MYNFKDFVKKFNIEGEVKDELHVADRGSKEPKDFGTGSLLTRTLQYTDKASSGLAGKPCKEYHTLSTNGDGASHHYFGSGYDDFYDGDHGGYGDYYD